jgi:hypothetical protein
MNMRSGFVEVGGLAESAANVFGVLTLILDAIGLEIGTALRKASGAIFEDDNCKLRGTALEATAAFSEEEPMARASAQAASFVDFSRICFCLSSSLARMETKSSGIGLFNLKF